ncbi:MAG: hypothetical protein LBC84_02445, partial [Prevotellaceae bacterium]|nr:hypothetical protein [Prevotellaceae bacterium]
KDLKDPHDKEEFKPSSYLFIRSFDGDNGDRPIPSTIPFWASPDLKISPSLSPSSYTTELNANTEYNFNCVVHNRGDLSVPSAKVEFYLVKPSLGFDTRFGKFLGVVSAWVNSFDSSEVNLTYRVKPEDAGHICLFARVFSFSPEDLPIDDYALNPVNDRHIGQKNLNIVVQGTLMQINLLHMPQAEILVQMIPMNSQSIIATRHPSIADFKIVDSNRMANRIMQMDNAFNLKFSKEIKNSKLVFQRGITNVANITVDDKGEFSLESQKMIYSRIQEINKIVLSGKAKASAYRKEYALYRKMNLENRVSPLSLQIPNLGLQKGEMVGFEINATNRINGEVFGGIMLLVTG